MSVTVRPYVNGGWEVDIRVQLPDGSVIRERKRAAASSKQAAQKCAESRERVLLGHLPGYRGGRKLDGVGVRGFSANPVSAISFSMSATSIGTNDDRFSYPLSVMRIMSSRRT